MNDDIFYYICVVCKTNYKSPINCYRIDGSLSESPKCIDCFYRDVLDFYRDVLGE